MPRKKKPPLTFAEIMTRLKKSGLDRSDSPNRQTDKPMDDLPTLEDRLKCIFNIVKRETSSAKNMIFFVMYDIENDKVRHQVVKYLIAKGCTRVQKSIFLADLPTEVYSKIRSDLTEVQACYENQDSILVVPISTDYLQAMRVIGKTINVDVITKSKNTLFF